MYPAYIQRGRAMSEKLQVSPPPYQQIADRYRHLISIGRFKAGDRLPALTQIATDFHVSPRTANKALRLLAAEGLVITTQQGSRVKEGPSVRASKESVAPRFGPQSTDRVTVTSASKVPTPEIVHGTLATEDDEVFRREAITERDGKPHTFSVCWVPLWAGEPFADQLQEEEHIPSLLTLISPPDLDEVPGQDWVTSRTIDSGAGGRSVAAGGRGSDVGRRFDLDREEDARAVSGVDVSGRRAGHLRVHPEGQVVLTAERPRFGGAFLVLARARVTGSFRSHIRRVPQGTSRGAESQTPG